MTDEKQRDVKKRARWYWMPVAVAIIGFSSMALLYAMEELSNQQRGRFALADALMDTQLHVANFHTQIEEYEEALAGGFDPGADKIWEILDQAISLVEATLWGGENEQGLVLLPLDDSEFRREAEHIRKLLLSFREIAVSGAGRGSIDPVKEERFDEVFDDVIEKAISLEKKVDAQNNAFLVRMEGTHNKIFFAWAVVLVLAVTGLVIEENLRKKAEEKLHGAHEVLSRQASELEQHRDHLEELVAARTAEVERLSDRLIDAQELERKRISAELHDALGQALNAVKLQLKVVERELTPGQSEAKVCCDELSEFIDETIEDVRRLSLNLSPTILEELGLTAALEWLVRGYQAHDDLRVEAEIEKIDHLVAGKQWITVYRIIQEALNNVEKHSRGASIKVSVRAASDAVAFRIKDDGAGFDLERALRMNAAESGLGLRTIRERVDRMGGHLDLQSAVGKGTTVAFTVPVQGEAG